MASLAASFLIPWAADKVAHAIGIAGHPPGGCGGKCHAGYTRGTVLTKGPNKGKRRYTTKATSTVFDQNHHYVRKTRRPFVAKKKKAAPKRKRRR